jgi:hypothetical protein
LRLAIAGASVSQIAQVMPIRKQLALPVKRPPHRSVGADVGAMLGVLWCLCELVVGARSELLGGDSSKKLAMRFGSLPPRDSPDQ